MIHKGFIKNTSRSENRAGEHWYIHLHLIFKHHQIYVLQDVPLNKKNIKKCRDSSEAFMTSNKKELVYYLFCIQRPTYPNSYEKAVANPALMLINKLQTG